MNRELSRPILRLAIITAEFPTDLTSKLAASRMADSEASTVIVIGSGFAGLGAARSLQDAGVNVSDQLINSQRQEFSGLLLNQLMRLSVPTSTCLII